MKLSICAGILFASLLPICSGKIWEIGISTSLQECYNEMRGVDVSTFVGSDHSWLCEMVFPADESQMNRRQINRRQTMCDRIIAAEPQKLDYINYLYKKTLEGGRTKCVRREYRMMTDTERDRFHGAVNTLKNNKTIKPNKYDAIARIHHGEIIGAAHLGPGFLGWHRIYLLMFETALREVDDSVCLPYWDSSLDGELDDDTNSPVWNNNFFGSKDGFVTQGPFRDWTTPDRGKLRRNVGDGSLFNIGSLFDEDAVEGILSGTFHIDYLERPHGSVHNYVGGNMAQNESPYDPIFFMHHAFVDYVWELFRTTLEHPEEYPDARVHKPSHLSSAPTCIGDSTQADGYKTIWTAEHYMYEDSPICSAMNPKCGSSHLTCLKDKCRCMPINTEVDEVDPFLNEPTTNQPIPTQQNRAHPGHRQQRNRRQVQSTPNSSNPGHTHTSEPNSGSCSSVKHAKRYINSVQNDYCCDSICDIDQWATIPVKIVNVRPPKFNTYDSYPVKDGRVQNGSDIYDPSAYNETKKYISRPMVSPKTYKQCSEDEMAGEVFLSSKGINYEGFYKEAAIVDNRLAASISVGFINVKKPHQGVTKALLRAHDSCGRVCQVACKDPKTGEYKKCSGAVAISNEEPLMYGNTYDEAVMNVFDFKSNKNFPSFQSDNFFITFYCDYHDEFPFVKDIPGQKQTPKRKVAKPVPVNGFPWSISSSSCQITKMCVIDQPCQTNKQCMPTGSTHVAACRGSCSKYAIRLYGQYFERMCPKGQRFDSVQERCVPGLCWSTPWDEQW